MNKTCKSIDEINQLIPSTRIYFMGMHQFFDPDEFSSDPVKSTVVLKVFSVDAGINNQNLYNLKQQNAILYNSYFSNGFNV